MPVPVEFCCELKLEKGSQFHEPEDVEAFQGRRQIQLVSQAKIDDDDGRWTVTHHHHCKKIRQEEESQTAVLCDRVFKAKQLIKTPSF